MDMGDMKSKDIGALVSAGLVNRGREILKAREEQKAPEEGAVSGQIPGTIQNQNLGHNSKKEGLGPNTKR
ncbi:hypothetical protein LI177_04735 [bacterium 210820-DFI.6.37]|nr:hypothetical protein [bacterium 210820-DFI.6.37]